MKLLKTHSITFTRRGSATDKTYVNEYGEVVQPTTTALVETCGSLQPFSKKTNRLSLPEGVREEDFLVYYTKSDLRTTDQFDNDVADTCLINGRQYKVTRKGEWSGFGLNADHGEYYLQLVQPKVI